MPAVPVSVAYGHHYPCLRAQLFRGSLTSAAEVLVCLSGAGDELDPLRPNVACELYALASVSCKRLRRFVAFCAVVSSLCRPAGLVALCVIARSGSRAK